MKKWILLLLCSCLLFCLWGCNGDEPENIVEDLKGPEGIEFFAGLWYCENRDVWVEVYYDGTWCSFEDGGMLRSYGSVTVSGTMATLDPIEGTDSFLLTATDGKLTDDLGYSLFKVTEVGVRKPLIINDLGVPDILPPDTKIRGDVDNRLAKEYAGFYISEDGIFALELYADGQYELQEYGLLIESGSFMHLTEPDHGQTYAVDMDMQKYRLVIVEEERLYLGDCGIFAPGEKSEGSEE